MNSKNKRKQRKIDLLEISEAEKAEIILKLKQTLRQAINEAKLWDSLLRCETLEINGQLVFAENESLKGIVL